MGTFTYNVKVPDAAAEGTYRFNGAVVLSSTGADVHNEGYYQEVTVAVPATAATLIAIAPNEGSAGGGTTVAIAGTGFVCTPDPTVTFGGTAGTVTACSATSITAKTPAHAAGAVTVTVTNSGAPASNGVTFTFLDDVAPTLDSISAMGQVVAMTFSEPVCVAGGTLAANTELRVKVNGSDVNETDIVFADCDADQFSTTADLRITNTVANGAEVALTITGAGADLVTDETGNTMAGSVTKTTTAVQDTTDPTIESVAATDEQTLAVTYSEPVACAGTDAGQFVFDPDASGTNVTATSYDCNDTRTVTVTFPTDTFAGERAGKLKYVADADPIADLSGNEAADQNVAITPTAFGDPLVTGAVVSRNGFRFTADMGDVITLTFNEAMDSDATGDVIRVKDDDDRIADISCTGTATDNDMILDASCDYDGDTLTLTLLESSTGETTAGGTATLAWPATIVDTNNVVDEEGNAPDLASSTDIEISAD